METWSTIIVPRLRRTTGEAGIAVSRSNGTIPTGANMSSEWQTAMYKSNAATCDIHCTSELG
eukprot:6404241-Pyramimonas_sp.AAC.1